MARDPASLHEIEKRAAERLKQIGASQIDALANVQEIDLGHFPHFAKNIAFAIGVEGGKAVGETARNVVKQGVQLRVLLGLKNLSGSGEEVVKRQTSLPIVEAVIRGLIFQDLGLQIDVIQLDSFKYKTGADLYKKGFIVWEIMFSTFLNYTKQDLEEYDDLNEIFVEYCLQDGTVPIKDTVHAADHIQNLQSE